MMVNRFYIHLRSTFKPLVCGIALAVGIAQPTVGVAEDDVVTITVSASGRSVNGVDCVPKGLFGVHAMNGLTDEIAEDWGIESIRVIESQPSGKARRVGTGREHGFITSSPAQIVECWFDRYRPALSLTASDSWENDLASLGRQWATSVQHPDHVLEFWNEPYLNWAAKPGVNYDGRFYENRNGQVWRGGAREPGLEWSERNVALRLPAATQSKDSNRHVDYLATRYMPKGLEPGNRFEWRKQPYQVARVPWVKDSEQPYWWSGPHNRELYHEMASVLGAAVREANPEAKVVVGWGFHLYQDNWQAWDVLHRPLIDLAAPWMHGYNEHHYGGDVRAVAGSYEVAWAYTLATHGKRIKMYNTEAGGFLDAERPNAGARSGPDGLKRLQRESQSTAYMLRDVVHLLDVCPDKAAARAAHMPDVYGGEAAFKLLKPLRGKLIHIDSGDPRIWAVASLSDTALCAVIFNDDVRPRNISLDLSAWGDRISQAVLRRPRVIDASLQLVEDSLADEVTIPSKQAVAVVWERADDAKIDQVVTIDQYVASEARVSLKPGDARRFTIEVPVDALGQADTARIKLVQAPWLRPVGAGWKVTLNGEPLDLRIPAGGGWIANSSIGVDRLREVNELTFELAVDADQDAAVDALSIEIQRTVSTATPERSSDHTDDLGE